MDRRWALLLKAIAAFRCLCFDVCGYPCAWEWVPFMKDSCIINLFQSQENFHAGPFVHHPWRENTG